MKNNYNEQTNISVDGHVLIKDMDTNEILLDKHNAINFQNFAFAVANIETMSFVLVSPSQLMALNEVCIFLFNNLLNTLEEISASVKT